ncbi:MAG: AMP-dependent synthetase, partial [Arachnia sp.]
GVVWNGQALPGVHVGLEPDERVPPPGGRITISGPSNFDGYLGETAATGEVLRDGVVWTNDWGTRRGGALEISGRLDDVIITGGSNVDLAAVRRAVTGIDPQAAVVAVPDAEWGTRIVLVAPGGDLTSWRASLGLRLPREALPRQHLPREVPRTPGGKPDRARILRWVGP